MQKSAIALMIGFTKNRELAGLSLKPLLALRKVGIIKEIIYVVGADPALDAYASYVSDYDGIRTIRSPRIHEDGLSCRQISLLSQIHNLKFGLDAIDDDDALVLKIRPDMVIEESFLVSKILDFDNICRPTNLYDIYKINMPAPIFKNKIWIPWADASMFFFYDDCLFLGLKQDVVKFTEIGDDDFFYLMDEEHFHKYNNYLHTWRFATPFLTQFPIFNAYMKHAPLFHRSVAYRTHLVRLTSQILFFWLLLIAHTWILATHFHVDIGRHRQMQVFSARANAEADWSRFETLISSTPFSTADNWRKTAIPGGFMPFLSGAYARIMDNSWLDTIFTGSDLRDLSSKSIERCLELIVNYNDGSLADMESDFYNRIRKFQSAYDAKNKA